MAELVKTFAKQDNVFLNSKARTLGLVKKSKKDRYYKNVGLGFKTPKEVGFAQFCHIIFMECNL